jgi:hypothetical protein
LAGFALSALTGCGRGGLANRPAPGDAGQAGSMGDVGAASVPSLGGASADSSGPTTISSTGGAAGSGGAFVAPSAGGATTNSGGSVPMTGGAAGSSGFPDSALDASAFGEKYKFVTGELPGWKQDTTPNSYGALTGDELVYMIDGAAGAYLDMGDRVSMYQDLVGPGPLVATVWAFDFVTAANATAMFEWETLEQNAAIVIPGYDTSVAIESASIVGVTAFAHFNGLYVEVSLSGLGDQTSTCSACPMAAQFINAFRAKANGG